VGAGSGGTKDGDGGQEVGIGGTKDGGELGAGTVSGWAARMLAAIRAISSRSRMRCTLFSNSKMRVSLLNSSSPGTNGNRIIAGPLQVSTVSSSYASLAGGGEPIRGERVCAGGVEMGGFGEPVRLWRE
jgi:hypothetical protein